MNLLRLRSSSDSFAWLSLTGGIIGSAVLAACGGGYGASNTQPSPPAPPSGTPSATFVDSALVSNRQGVVATMTIIDANLSNPWGLAVAPGKPFWIADNNSNLTTLYTGAGTIETALITGSSEAGIAIPASAAGVPANPTGQVYNGSGGFLIATTRGQEPAQFIFDGEGGTLSAWAQDSGSTAVTVYDDGAVNGANAAVYKGLAVATVNGAPFLYATDLHNGKVDVFDTQFAKPAAMQGKFVDPSLPAGYVPFGITALGGQLYVTYAAQDAAKHDETIGAGLGYVNVFDPNGNLLSRFASTGVLNAPWGIAVAPAGFGSFEGDVLIGNFGDGRINVFKPNATGEATSLGSLSVSNGGTVVIPGLWSLVFGNGDADKPLTTLFYTAGFVNQTDGVFGGIALGSGTAPPPSPYGG
jgi:uncharacterized protein (TIGR03118 family)